MRRNIRLVTRAAAPLVRSSHVAAVARAGGYCYRQQHDFKSSSWTITSRLGTPDLMQRSSPGAMRFHSSSSSSSPSSPPSLQALEIIKEPILPSHRLLARAFHRVSSSAPNGRSRGFSSSARAQKWEGRQPEENASREKEKDKLDKNVQHDAVREGKADRAGTETSSGSRGATGKSGGSNEKAKEEFPEAPDTIGMQDERGGKN